MLSKREVLAAANMSY